MFNKYEEILSVIESLDDDDIVCLWNEYCYETNNYDDEILDYDRMEELIENSGESGLYWINRFFYGSDENNDNSSANPNRNYFTFNGYGNIESFDYVYNKYAKEFGKGDGFNHIDVEDLINYMIENDTDFDNDDIREILDTEEE